MNTSERESVTISGNCPVTNDVEDIVVTYSKFQAIGQPVPYAVVSEIVCPNAYRCHIAECPIAYSRQYW